MTSTGPAPTKPRWRTWLPRVGLFLVVPVCALLAAVKVVIELRDQVDPVDVGAMAQDFDRTAVHDSAGQLPTGIWAYDATGSEYIDILGGPLHEFPAEVAQIVTDSDCGQSIEVRLFEQRHDTLDMCTDSAGRLVLDRFVTQHEFVGITDVTTTDGCAEVAIWWPGIGAADAARPTTVRCHAHGDMSGEVDATVTQEVIGHDTVDVAGAPVDAVRVRITSTVGTSDSPTHGTYISELWFGQDEPIVLRRTLDAQVNAATPFGAIGFEEQFDITLQDLEPAS